MSAPDCPLCSRPLPSAAGAQARGCPSCGWAAPAPEHSLSPDQQAAWDALESTDNVFLSGPGGTGKSWLISKWLREGSAKDKSVAVLASTGIAATHIGGRTLHSWAGMGLGTETAERIADDPRWGWRFRIAPRIRATDVILVDEVSMVCGRLLALLSDLCKIARGPKGAITAKQRQRGERQEKLPFGGAKFVAVGDMGQLAPIEEETGFPFETSEWWDARIMTAELTTVHRQADAAFVAVLSQIRQGTLDEAGRAMLEARVNAFDPDAEPQAVRVATHNRQVDAVNEARLAEIPGEPSTFLALEEGDPRGIEFLDKHCLSPRDLRIKVGARVMFTRNDPTDGQTGTGRFVNGTLGTVTWVQGGKTDGHAEQGEGGFEVTTDDGVVLCPEPVAWHHGVEGGDLWVPEKWTKKLVKRREAGKGEAVRVQYPVKLAWSMSIHKCQGLSLSRVSLDIGDCFAPGQAYVALSRARSLEGLNIERWSGPASVFAHPTAVAFIRGEYRPPETYVPAAPPAGERGVDW